MSDSKFTTQLTVQLQYLFDTRVDHKQQRQTKTLNDTFVNDGFNGELGLQSSFIQYECRMGLITKRAKHTAESHGLQHNKMFS